MSQAVAVADYLVSEYVEAAEKAGACDRAIRWLRNRPEIRLWELVRDRLEWAEWAAQHLKLPEQIAAYLHANGCSRLWRDEEGRLHRVGGPAVERPDGYEEWWVAGQRHRADGPAVVWPDGYRAWYLCGRLHRADGPAIVYPDGYRAWYLCGRLHRADGPAVERPDGSAEWYREGRLHREDGPAVVRPDGYEEWWVDGYRHR